MLICLGIFKNIFFIICNNTLNQDLNISKIVKSYLRTSRSNIHEKFRMAIIINENVPPSPKPLRPPPAPQRRLVLKESNK